MTYEQPRLPTPADEAAFPCSGIVDSNDNVIWEGTNSGMSMREWYAGMALIGLVWKSGSRLADQEAAGQIAETAFIMADAMLAEAVKE